MAINEGGGEKVRRYPAPKGPTLHISEFQSVCKTEHRVTLQHLRFLLIHYGSQVNLVLSYIALEMVL